MLYEVQNAKTGEICMSKFATVDEAAEFLKGSKNSFANSLVEHVENGVQLSSVQKYWLHRLATEKKLNTVDGFKTKALLKAFESAKFAGLKDPRLVFKVEDLKVTIYSSLAVRLNNGFYGTISPAGQFTFRGDKEEPVLQLLATLCLDPQLTCETVGKNSGICCCCGRELTNPESIELGIGPICRERWSF